MYASAASRCASSELNSCWRPSSVDFRVYIAHRTTRFSAGPVGTLAADRGALFLAIGSRPNQIEEDEAVPFGAGGFAGDGAQGPIVLAVELEPIDEDLHDDSPTFVLALEVGPGRWQPRIEITRHLSGDAQFGIKRGVLPKSGPGCPYAQVGIVRDLQRAAAGALGEAAFGQRLNSPGDPPKQELLVVRAGLLAEHLQVLLLELTCRHPAQRLNFFLHLHRGLHAFLLSQGR